MGEAPSSSIPAHGETAMSHVGVIGLGIMGLAYARNLINAGFEVIGTDIEQSRLDQLEALGGHPVQSAGAVGDGSDVVLVALASVAAFSDMLSGEGGLLGASRPGLVVIEMGTLPLDTKMEALESLAQGGTDLLDAPVSGTGLQAESAEIVVYASGAPAALSKARPIFDAIAKATFDLGAFGNGSKMKFVANLLVSIHNLATAEAFTLGMKSGLAPEQILQVISAGVGSSKIFEIRGPMIVDDDYPAAAKLQMFLKDIDIIGNHARSLGVPTPLLDASLPLYRDAVERGLGELDAAALARLLEGRANLDR